jgi:hypothetical protein
MMCIIHYISAIRRLKESEKTVMMLGGESECQTMILAQRDMIKLEKEYYHDEVMKLAILFVIFVPFTFASLGIYYKFFH